MLSYATITASRAGRVVDRLAEPGDTASPGQPLLTLYDARSLRLEAPVREELAVTLKVGQKLAVRIDSLKPRPRGVDRSDCSTSGGSQSILARQSRPARYARALRRPVRSPVLIDAGERSHLCLAQAAIERVGQLDFCRSRGQRSVAGATVHPGRPHRRAWSGRGPQRPEGWRQSSHHGIVCITAQTGPASQNR